jgi:hypothetical protein
MSDFAVGVFLAILGIAIALILGMRATKSRSQHQKTKGGSVSIQSGRDTKIGEE